MNNKHFSNKISISFFYQNVSKKMSLKYKIKFPYHFGNVHKKKCLY